MKLNVKAFAIACGVLWGLGVFILTWWVIAFEGISDEPTLLGRVYRGHTFTALGSLIGLAWAVPDGFFGGLIFAWLYNVLSRCCPWCSKTKAEQ